MPILAKRLKRGFDENGVSIVSVEGNYFGLMIKLLRGLGFPWRALCDRDAMINISRGTIKEDGEAVKTSQVFHSLYDADLLSTSQLLQLREAQSQIGSAKNTVGNAEIYRASQIGKLDKIATAHRFHVLSTDFEGLFSKQGHGQLIRRAREIHGRTKRLQGVYLAQTVKAVPQELRRVIFQVTSAH